MLKGVHDERRKSGKEETNTQVCGEDGGSGSGGGARWRKRRLPPREHSTSAAIAMEAEVPSRRNRKPQRHQARPKTKRRSKDFGAEDRDGASVTGTVGDIDRASGDEKKRSLGLEGPLYGRHLTRAQRESLCMFIDESRREDSVETVCGHLQMHPRSYYRWKRGGACEEESRVALPQNCVHA